MIDAPRFMESARRRGLGLYAGVPCSYLKPLINRAIEDRQVRYVSSANEGDAVAAAAGACLGGVGGVAMMQNSGLGNAVSPLASLTWVFRFPVLLIVTLRGDPEIGDEPQHRLMGPITTTVLEALRVPWELFPTEPDAVEPALARACEHMERERRPFAFVMRKGSVAPYELGREGTARPRRPAPGSDRAVRRYAGRAPDRRPSRAEALERIVQATGAPGTVVIATTGYTGRELCAIADRPNHLYMVGSMGCASSLGLGLALTRADLRVVVVDGDGAALMRMGNLATVGAYGAANLTHVVLDNEVHDSTGGQETVSDAVSFAGIASACGYGLALEGDEISILDELFAAQEPAGPRFAQLKIKPGTRQGLPRPSATPEQVKERLMAHIGSENTAWRAS